MTGSALREEPWVDVSVPTTSPNAKTVILVGVCLTLVGIAVFAVGLNSMLTALDWLTWAILAAYMLTAILGLIELLVAYDMRRGIYQTRHRVIHLASLLLLCACGVAGVVVGTHML